MDKENKTDYWIVDDVTYQNLQQLKQFVDFVAQLPSTSECHKKNADKVKWFIENINNPENFKTEWNTCIDIFDPMIQNGAYGRNFEKNKGLYWKRWTIWFEMESLQISIVDEYADENGYQDEKWIFDSVIYFNKDIGDERVNGDTDYSIFVKDAFNFRNYITEDLNDVETEIEIYEDTLPEKEKEFYSVPVFKY
jgi:hypothetical protein